MKTIYCIKNQDGKIVYVGQTKNFQRRKWEHTYRKHIPKTYTFEVLEECSDSDAINREKFYINKFNTIECGLNIVCGNGQSGIYGNGFGGRFEKGNKAWSNRTLKKIRCLETDTIYDNVKECAESLGIKDATKIYGVCNGFRKSYHKYHFEYID